MRIFPHRVPATDEHSLIMGTEVGGLSERYEEQLEFDPDTTTLEELRFKVETVFDRGMNRRTRIFQELHQVMQRSKNFHSWPHHKASTFRFGLLPLPTGMSIANDRSAGARSGDR